MITEADVKTEIKEYLTSIGAWFFMPVPTGYGKRGIPDFIVCFRGKFVAFEVKRPPEGKRAVPTGTPWQERTLAEIHAAQGVAAVVWDLAQVQCLLAHAQHQ